MSNTEVISQEVIQWREDLAHPKDLEITLEEILKAMSNGFEVSELFPDILKLMTIRDLKLKKLVYIFLTANARSNEAYTILLVNALVFDTENEEPIIRALALRTMAAVAIPEVAEQFAEEFVKFSTDKDPFVRKTVCTAISKLYTVSSDTCDDLELIKKLHDMLFDSNEAVVAASVNSLVYIHKYSNGLEIIFSKDESEELLTALTQSSEWNSHAILTGLAEYAEIADSQTAIVRIEPFLKHGNPAVALAAVNLLLKLNAGELVTSTLLSLVSQAQCPEVEFVALRALRLAASTLQHEDFIKNMKLFYVRFNDEIYIKLEKIEILASLVTESTAIEILAELQDYSQDVNDQIVRAALKAISKIAMILPEADDLCVETFLLLLKGEFKGQKINNKLPSYAAEELLVEIMEIFRFYPNRYESIISELCEEIAEYDDFRAKAALIWILGEYASRIEGVEDVISDLLGFDSGFKNLLDEHSVVQMETVTAITKICLSVENEVTEQLFHGVIDTLVFSDDPAVRMRSKYLLKLFKLDPSLAAAKTVLFVQKSIPVYNDGLSPIFKQSLYCKLGSVPATLRQIINVQKTIENTAEEVIEEFENEEYVQEPIVPELSPEQLANVQLNNTEEEVINLPEVRFDANLPEQAPGIPEINLQASGPQSGNYHVQNPAEENVVRNVIDDLLGLDFSEKPLKEYEAPEMPSFVNSQVESQMGVEINTPMQYSQPVANASTATTSESAYELSPVTASKAAAAPADFESPQALQDQNAPYTYYNIPCRPKESNYPLELQLAIETTMDSVQLLVLIKNVSDEPIKEPHLLFSANPFGIEAADPGIAIIPALNNYNNGAPVSFPLFNEESGGPFLSKLAVPDPNMRSGFNILRFEIESTGAQPMQYQLKLPLCALFYSSSPWHQKRVLTNAAMAQAALSQASNWPESRELFSLQTQDFQQTISALIGELQKSNVLVINASGELGDFVGNLQIFEQSVIAFIRIFWAQQGGNTLQLTVSVRLQDRFQIAAGYIVNNICQMVGKK